MKPLDGVRVLDLSRLLPGPFASLVLADMGATVDKLEDTHGGDYLRHMPPQIDGESGMFLAINRGKQSAVIDLKHAKGREAFLEMLASYDVLIDQFRPGVMARLGLSHESLREKFPRLIVCAITGYGQNGPLRDRAGHDINYLARAGILGFQGPANAAPQPPGFQLADVSSSLYSVIGILGALVSRAQNGEGALLDISMTESAIGFASIGFGTLLAGGESVRGEDVLTGGIAPYNTYETEDGKYVALGALEPKFWGTFCAAVNLPCEMSALMPGEHQPELKKTVAAIFKTKTREEWITFSTQHDCCLEPVLTPKEATEDAHLRARGAFFSLASAFGPILQFSTPVSSESSNAASPPKQGEHTDSIFGAAGFSAERIAELKSAGAIR